MAYNAGTLQANLSLNFQQFANSLRQVGSMASNIGSQFRNSFNQANSSINTTSNAMNNMNRQMKDFERVASGIVFAQAFYGTKTAIESATASLVGFMNDMQKAQISMEYFLGDSEKAAGFIDNMKDFAATTSFNTEQALNLSRKLLAAQVDPGQVRSYMEILNDAAAASGGTAEQMDRVVLAISQMKTNGKIAGQELRQLAEAGIPAYKILQEELGLTAAQMKDIGKLGISGDKGVEALLRGLEKRYKGAALRIANTLPGIWETIKDDTTFFAAEIFKAPYVALEGFLRRWRDALEKARAAFRTGGLGAALNEMFSPQVANAIRLVAGSLQTMGQAFATLYTAMEPVIFLFNSLFTQTVGMVLPVIAGIVNAIAQIVAAAYQAYPALQYLTVAIMGLLVAQAVARVMMFFWAVLRIGLIAQVVARAVLLLRNAMYALMIVVTRNPIVGLIMLIAGALLYLAMSSREVSKWLDQLMARLASLGGFKLDGILQPETKDTQKWMDDFNQELGGIGEGAGEGLGDSMDKAGKKAKKKAKEIKDTFLAAFDEVFQIPDKKDSGGDDGGGGGGGGGPGGGGPGGGNIPNLPLPNIPDFPREIELPKLVFPPIDWPMIPPYLTKPIPINFKIDPPNFPPFNGAVATAWVTTMDAIRAAIRGVTGALDWVGQQVPKLLPLLNPMPVLNPMLNAVKGWAGEIKAGFIGIKNSIPQLWEQGWTAISRTASTGTAAVSKTLSGAWTSWKTAFNTGVTNVKTLWGGMKDYLIVQGALWASAIGIIWSQGWNTLKTTVMNSLNSIKTFWENHKKAILITVGALVLGVLLIWAEIPAAIIAGLGAMVLRIGQILLRVAPLFTAAFSKIGPAFTKLVGKLPQGAQNIVTSIVEKFSKLPSAIAEAIKSIPAKIAGILGKIKIPSFSSAADGVKATFSSIGHLAGFASGGIIGKDSIVRVGEGGRREAIVPLQNASAMKPFVDAVVNGLHGRDSFGGGGGGGQPTMVVHTLIADERGLRELERKLNVVRLNNQGSGRR